ncbi:MAG: hypothetical protein C0596_10920 [Marinilabiliales bacterium]|nr:MAG: hypothetical protein C0596_10920 [Marinilabiliales bacterium]
MSGTKKTKQNITSGFLKIIRNRNILVFFIFFAIASFLWFLNAINKEYTTDINLGYEVKNLPETMSVKESSDNKLVISVSGHGYNLLREELEKVKLPLIIDLKSKKNKINLYNCVENCTQSYILTNDLKPIIKKRFGENIKIVKISPDTIYFDINLTYSRKLPVIPQIDYKASIDYMQNGSIKTKPDSITVYGPSELLDTMQGIYTIYSDLGSIGENHIKELKIKQVKNFKYSKTDVLVDIPLEKYTETEIIKDIVPINVPEGFVINLIPESVSIYYKVPISLFESISEEDFEVTANYETEQNEEIVIDAVPLNKSISITKLTPLSAKYILEAKDTIND